MKFERRFLMCLMISIPIVSHVPCTCSSTKSKICKIILLTTASRTRTCDFREHEPVSLPTEISPPGRRPYVRSLKMAPSNAMNQTQTICSGEDESHVTLLRLGYIDLS